MAENTKIRWGWSSASLIALGMALGLGGASAYAQDEPAVEEEIVVTGFRASLAAAVDIKREEVGAVDAIVAEDIADFPDLEPLRIDPAHPRRGASPATPAKAATSPCAASARSSRASASTAWKR